VPDTPDKQSPVIIVDYDATWPETVERLRARAWGVVGDIADTIEHVGSTAVSGLAAKPIIDMDVVVPTAQAVRGAIARLATLGYRHRGDLGIENREAFRAPAGDPAHHLYVCLAGSSALLNHLRFRDALRRDADVAAEYAALKRRLAVAFRDDREGYNEAKTEFVLRIITRNR
jgi:GrpB-like predicted nucleotidyltransferase (UPF0157 family)